MKTFSINFTKYLQFGHTAARSASDMVTLFLADYFNGDRSYWYAIKYSLYRGILASCLTYV